MTTWEHEQAWEDCQFACFGERGAGELIAGLFGEDGDDGEAGVKEGGAWEVRSRVGAAMLVLEAISIFEIGY